MTIKDTRTYYDIVKNNEILPKKEKIQYKRFK